MQSILQSCDRGRVGAGGEVDNYAVLIVHFRLPLRFTPALCNAIAIACFRGLPACSSVLMLWAIADLDRPLRSGLTRLHHPAWNPVPGGPRKR